MSKFQTEEGSFSRTIEVIFKDRVRESYRPSEYGRFYRYMKGIDIETGAATYVFNDTLQPAQLVRKCEVTPKLLILQMPDLQEKLGFKGRAIHAKQAETADSEEAEKYFNRWLSDVKRLVGV